MSVWGRRHARRALIQALYQWQLTAHDAANIRAQFVESGALKKADAAFFDACLGGVVAQANALDAAFSPFLDREIGALDQVEKAILRAGAFELRFRPDVPRKVVIDEYIRVARIFGAQDSYKYVNGVLDALARSDGEPSAGEREGLASRKKALSAGELEGLAPSRETPSAGEREEPAPNKEQPSAGEREGLVSRKKTLSIKAREGNC